MRRKKKFDGEIKDTKGIYLKKEWTKSREKNLKERKMTKKKEEIIKKKIDKKIMRMLKIFVKDCKKE